MTRLIFWLIGAVVVLLLGGVFALMMTKDPGVMMLTYNGWMVETTFWTGIGFIVSTVLVILVCVALFRKFAPTRIWSNYRNRRDQKVAKKETAIAIHSWLKGSDDRTLQAIDRIVAAGGSGRLPAAVSLAVGMHHGDWLERYAKFIEQDPELKLFADALQAERLWQLTKYDDFIDLMRSRFDLRQVAWLRDRFWQAMLLEKKSAELVTIVNEAANIQPEYRQNWLLKAAVAALAEMQGDVDAGNVIFKSLSKHQRNLPDIVQAEVRYRVSIGEHEQAFKRLKFLLSHDANVERCASLLDIKIDNLQKINFIESVEPLNPGPEYCRTAGVINLRQQLWGNAQSWLEQGWKQGDSLSGFYLAELFEQRNMMDQATRLYRELANRSMAKI
ncbi:hypothetical protein [Reinekea sp. G2M2-21]|uniref:hypothetical protein n=1 Tax=Reinekea sp. G2M2-21 TaxID=2788942 RepID=UPI0018AA41B3|nr:hypothetical protein [Reinekea sp. G2M2-21]